MTSADVPERPVIRAARPGDAALLLELFRELAEYEHLEHELRATEKRLNEALFSERPGRASSDRRAGRRDGRLRPVLPDLLELSRD